MLATIRLLYTFVRPQMGLLLISLALAVPLAGLKFAPAPLIKHFFDKVLTEQNSKLLSVFPLLILLIYAVNFVVRFLHYYLYRIVVTRVVQDVKSKLFHHLMGLSADYFTDQSTGTLISRTASDPDRIDSGIASLNGLVREPLTFLLLLGYAFSINWKLTFLMISVFPVLVVFFAVTGRLLKHYFHRMQEQNAQMTSVLHEVFSGIRVVKTFQLEKYGRKKFKDQVKQFVRINLKSAAIEELSHPMIELLTAFLIAGVIYYGGKQVIAHKMTSGELLSFFTAFGLMLDPIRKWSELNIKLQQARAACERIQQVLNWRSNILESPTPKPLQSVHREIRFDQVSFSYPGHPNQWILKEVALAIPKGKVMAIVGESGAGKSSMINLLPRIFDVTEGRILIDGIDIRDLSLKTLRSLISVVSQEVFLFNDTIKENIRCGRFSASDTEIIAAAKKAHAYDFIQRLPQGWDTRVGERGQKLSGGERQRISIARAFLRNAPILVLDEATSNLDTASEREVQKAIEELMQHKTALVIAHRLSTIRHADQIVVLKNGKIVEQGIHDELLEKGGEYARFHQTQQLGFGA